MATNVTTDTVLYMKQKLAVTEINLTAAINRITNYNENVVPRKNEQFARTLEERKAKRAARPEKYAKKAPLPENPRVLTPIDIDTCMEVIGLRREVEAYKYFIDILNGNKPKPGNFTIEDYRKFVNKNIKNWSIKYKCAKTRLARKRNELKQKKLDNPKKYGKRPDLPEVNMEMINAERSLNHYQKVLYLIDGVNPKQTSKKINHYNHHRRRNIKN